MLIEHTRLQQHIEPHKHIRSLNVLATDKDLALIQGHWDAVPNSWSDVAFMSNDSGCNHVRVGLAPPCETQPNVLGLPHVVIVKNRNVHEFRHFPEAVIAMEKVDASVPRTGGSVFCAVVLQQHGLDAAVASRLDPSSYRKKHRPVVGINDNNKDVREPRLSKDGVQRPIEQPATLASSRDKRSDNVTVLHRIVRHDDRLSAADARPT